MKTRTFTSKNVIQKLVDHYGLPAFLFSEIDSENFHISVDKEKKKFKLFGYSKYNDLTNSPLDEREIFLFEDLWNSHQEIIASKISWYAGEHNKIDARKCSIAKITEEEAKLFLDRFHLLNYAKANHSYALIHEKQICAVASFSHGRKMNRLPINKLGFELIRFATIPCVSITGGLSKLVTTFAEELLPGDIMTYVDPLLGDIIGLKKIGFNEIGFTKPIELFVNTKTHERLHKKQNQDNNVLHFFTLGNHKLVKTFV